MTGVVMFCIMTRNYFSFCTPNIFIPAIARYDPKKPLPSLTKDIIVLFNPGLLANNLSIKRGSIKPCRTWYRILLTTAMKVPVYKQAWKMLTVTVAASYDGISKVLKDIRNAVNPYPNKLAKNPALNKEGIGVMNAAARCQILGFVFPSNNVL